MFKSVLDSIPDKKDPNERLFSLEDAIRCHPSFHERSPEAWILFLSERPDIQGEDRKDCIEVIKRLYANEKVEFTLAMEQWSEFTSKVLEDAAAIRAENMEAARIKEEQLKKDEARLAELTATLSEEQLADLKTRKQIDPGAWLSRLANLLDIQENDREVVQRMYAHEEASWREKLSNGEWLRNCSVQSERVN